MNEVPEMKTVGWTIACLAIFGSACFAQDIAGDWQGALQAGPRQLRLLVHVDNGVDGGWKGWLATLDQGDPGARIPADSISLEGGDVKIGVAQIRGRYEGNLSADGSTMSGTWTQGVPLRMELKRATPETAYKHDSKHSVQFVTVDKDVKLEVLDWGGTGRPMVFVPGLGNTAHVFDTFAQKLTPKYHVYGVTRRGFGASSAPASGYEADRLGDDVLAVLDALKIEKPVLAGHSLGGEELSSIGSRHPERIGGMIYLDAAYVYAFYDPSHADAQSLQLEVPDLLKKIAQLQPGNGPADPRPLIKELLESTLPAFERDLREQVKMIDLTPPAMLAAQSAGLVPLPLKAIMSGMQKYNKIPVPILAIYAVPHDLGPQANPDPAKKAAREAIELETIGAQAKAFETAVPTARVVRIAHANHYIFRSNEADVVREIDAFVGGLK
jgi:pimeloyl-ACP methyl ester carboxylesterase